MDASAICDMVLGYVDGFERAVAKFGIEVEALEELLLDNQIEQCPGCELYCHCAERLPDGSNEPDAYCDNCRPKSS